MKKSWYFCMGSDPTSITSYQKINSHTMFLCGNRIAAILADGEGTHPNEPISNNMYIYIKNALQTGQLQPETPVWSKKYVYLKDN